jgi:hypothetical protein
LSLLKVASDEEYRIHSQGSAVTPRMRESESQPLRNAGNERVGF